ncbi:hypothetical protein OBV_33700 [Oscillibacter valericigenes Sjm18-20]|nr:hypothetical protein OBV_33700 [Oscillibacter valericigenes Sjm18-20]
MIETGTEKINCEGVRRMRMPSLPTPHSGSPEIFTDRTAPKSCRCSVPVARTRVTALLDAPMFLFAHNNTLM